MTPPNANSSNNNNRVPPPPPPSSSTPMRDCSYIPASVFPEFIGYRGKLVDMACTQNGSRVLQTLLQDIIKFDSSSVRQQIPPHSSPGILDLIVHEIAPASGLLMCDTFANYFVQPLFQLLSHQQKQIILQHMVKQTQVVRNGLPITAGGMYRISVDRTGTYALQNIIDHMYGSESLGRIMMSALDTETPPPDLPANETVILALINDNKAAHVIQRIMKSFQPSVWYCIYRTMQDHCYAISINRFGSMVLRQCFDYLGNEWKKELGNTIIQCSRELAGHSIGNYVVQYILKGPNDTATDCLEVREEISNRCIESLSGHFAQLSKSKYSSNVAEKCITVCELKENRSIRDELLNPSVIATLLDTHFGSGILQKQLAYLPADEIKAVSEAMSKYRISGTNQQNTNLQTKYRQLVDKINK